MNREPAYRAARAIAATVEQHFANQHEAARERGEGELAPEPGAAVVEAMVDATFWASLQREEGRSPKISLAYLPPERAGQSLVFERRLPFQPSTLIKLAPAVERPGIHLGVWRDEDDLYVWGATRYIPSLCFILEVIEPGLLVIKHRRADGFGKFANVAVLHGEEVKIVDEEGDELPDCPGLLTSLLGFASPSALNERLNVLVQLAVSMRDHGRGGTLLVVPDSSRSWRESMIHPIQYSVVPAFKGLSELVAREEDEDDDDRAVQAALRRAVEGVAGLTAVDGATVMSDRYELLAFGAKIGRPRGSATVERVVVTEPVVGNAAVVTHPSQLGGTRHLSAAQFAHDQRDAVALVASQDGRFTLFAWSPCEDMVHAHRIDILLL